MQDYINWFILLSIATNGRDGRVLKLEKARPTLIFKFNAIMPAKITIKVIMVS